MSKIKINPNSKIKYVLRDVLSPISTSEIYEWARDNLSLPTSYAVDGKFNVNRSKYLIEPFKAVKDRSVREVVLLWGVQLGKSMISDISICWHIANRPCPMQLTMQTDKMVADHVNNRLYPLMKSARSLRRMLPPIEKDYTNYGLDLGHCHLYVNGEKPSALQGKSIALAICDECWKWKPGSLNEAKARVTAYEIEKKSKILIISQPGVVNDDLDKEYKMGNMEEWQVPCEKCGEYQVCEWRSQRDDGSYYGILWTTDKTTVNEDGQWNYPELYKTIRYECKHCKHQMKDTPELKKFWNDKGKYVATNPNGAVGVRSFRMNSIPVFPWSTLVEDFIAAKKAWDYGVKGQMREFQQQRLCKPYNAFEYTGAGKIKTDVYDVESDWKDAVVRFMTIDCQKYHFWVEIREWAADGRSRQLYFGKCLNDDIIKLREKWDIQPKYVFVDVGNSELDESTGIHLVHKFVCENKYIGLRPDHWADRNNGFTRVLQGNKVKLLWSEPKPLQSSGHKSIYFAFAPQAVTDIVDTLRRGKGAEFKCLENKDFENHMLAEKRIKIIDKYGVPKWMWKNVDGKPNHGLDCVKMSVVAALMNPKVTLI